MKLSGLHLLLTYQCNLECDHCFVWGGPGQSGVMTLEQIDQILIQAREVDGLDWVYFEGGEPFLYYPILLRGVQLATARGFHTGIVSNAFWATSEADALVWLRPFADLIEDLTISRDMYHFDEARLRFALNATRAADELHIPLGTICIAQPEDIQAAMLAVQNPRVASAVMYRGRAAKLLASRASLQPWESLTVCPYEDLREPGRVHLDPFGNLQICQGISLGNVFEHPLPEICERYYAETHPICGPLLKGGPAGLVLEYGLPHKDSYADACHLCYECRLALRKKFPEILMPDQMYGG